MDRLRVIEKLIAKMRKACIGNAGITWRMRENGNTENKTCKGFWGLLNDHFIFIFSLLVGKET